MSGFYLGPNAGLYRQVVGQGEWVPAPGRGKRYRYELECGHVVFRGVCGRDKCVCVECRQSVLSQIAKDRVPA